MTTPTVKAISTKYGTKVDYGTDMGYLEGALPKVLQGNPYIENVISWQKIDVEQYDAVIDLTCPCVEHEKPRAEPINRVDLFARHVGIPLINHDLDYTITDEEAEWAQEYLASNYLDKYQLILVHASASNVARDIPPSKLRDTLTQVLANRNIRALVLTHSSDGTKRKWDFANVHVLHNFDVRQITALIPHCALVLCPDSAVLHQAAALHHPTVTVFGPTDPRARVNYHPEAVAIWPAKHLNNYPVWYADPKDGYLCWKRLEVDTMVKVVNAMLYNHPLPQGADLVTFGDHLIANQYYEVL
jgi:ADP-heptose:LPS heptosyltransferase